MPPAPALTRYALYGESLADTAPEFLHVEPISARSRLHDWTISPHSHPGIHQLLLLLCGSGQLLADMQELPLAPGMAIAIPSHCVHAFRFDPGSEGWVFSFAVELLHDPRLAQVAGIACYARRSASVAQAAPGDPALARLDWLMGDLAAELGQGTVPAPGNRLVAQVSLLLASVDELLGATAHPPAPIDRQRQLAQAFRALVDRRYREWGQVPAYAAALGTSVPTLTRACRAVLGKAPGELLRDRLLLEAMRYLTFTSASVSRIADELGFADPAYFARFFKQRTGQPASLFRANRGWFDSPAPAASSTDRSASAITAAEQGG